MFGSSKLFLKEIVACERSSCVAAVHGECIYFTAIFSSQHGSCFNLHLLFSHPVLLAVAKMQWERARALPRGVSGLPPHISSTPKCPKGAVKKGKTNFNQESQGIAENPAT